MSQQNVQITPGEVAVLVEVINRTLLWSAEQIVLANLINKLKLLSAPQPTETTKVEAKDGVAQG